MAIQRRPRGEPIDPIDYKTLRAKAFAAWSRGPTATYRAWFEDAFQEGVLGHKRAVAEREVNNPEGYIVGTGRNFLLGLHPKGRRTTALDQNAAALVDPGAAERLESIEDEAERAHHACVVRQVLVEEFDERERQLIRLKYDLQRNDREIAKLMGITPRAVKRQFLGKREKGQPGINLRLAEYIGPTPDETLLCARRRSQVKALAGGWTMSETRKAKVRTHLESCEGCRAFTRRALGYRMLLPPVTLPASIAGGERGTLAEGAVALKQHLADSFATGKQQAVALHARVTGLDPATLPAVRPGAVAGAVAGCLAVGSGATYCLTEGVPDPLRAPLGIAQPETRPHKEADAKPVALPPPSPATQPTPLPERPSSGAPTSQPAAQSGPTATAPAPQTAGQIEQRNFGIEPQPRATAASSAPARASGGGSVAQKEFGVVP